ncbi:MAG: lipoate--protein ligase [Eubacteriales bacterium]|nr:lipoate--protein ligase [Eubacteriales bacterium]
MIKKLSIYITDNVIPYRNLAVEKYLTLHVQSGECVLFLWQNRQTVVIGRNQNCWKECKVNCLEEDGGYLARRLSGGGAVFHDLGNLNFTFCVREEDYHVDRQLEVILKAMQFLGIHAEKTGRNDITVSGRKFSGNAFYKTNGCCYHHGTLLVDTDKSDMSKYLSVSREKLQTKSVTSVKARVINLKEAKPDLTIRMLEEKMAQAFEEVYGLAAEKFPEERFDWQEIDEYEREFASWEWKYGRRIPFHYQMHRRFEWGDIELRFQVNRGLVEEAQAFSDGMEQALIEALPERFIGLRYDARSLCEALRVAETDPPLEQQIKADIWKMLAECM